LVKRINVPHSIDEIIKIRKDIYVSKKNNYYMKNISKSDSIRTTMGTLVHLIVLVFGVVGAGIVVLLSKNESTKVNARNALNWQLAVIGAIIVAIVMAFGLGELVTDLFVFPAALLIIIVGLLNFVFCLLATYKAIRGDAWEYPFAPNFV